LRKPDNEDKFSSELKHAIEGEIMSKMSAYAFRSLITFKIQEYSQKISMTDETVSPCFLKLCDLMIAGNLSRMPENALKVYVLLQIYKLSEKEQQYIEIIRKSSGMSTGEITDAIQYLDDNGYFTISPTQGRGIRLK
jgi:hypothetical protein